MIKIFKKDGFIFDGNPIRQEKSYDSAEKARVVLIGAGPYNAGLFLELYKRGLHGLHWFAQRDGEDDEAKAENIKLFNNQAELEELMDNSGAEYFVMAFYPHKINEHIVEKYHGRFLNLHGSDLPNGRGIMDPVSNDIEEGRSYGTLTLHLVDKEIDTGHIVDKLRLDYSCDDAMKVYQDDVIPTAAGFIIDVMKRIDKIEPVPQLEHVAYLRKVK